jgi:hypothetical protein
MQKASTSNGSVINSFNHHLIKGYRLSGQDYPTSINSHYYHNNQETTTHSMEG